MVVELVVEFIWSTARTISMVKKASLVQDDVCLVHWNDILGRVGHRVDYHMDDMCFLL